MGLIGFWMGGCIGLTVQLVLYLILILTADWDRITDDVHDRILTDYDGFRDPYDF